jgi:hypothetical protein
MASSVCPFELKLPDVVPNNWSLGLVHNRKKLETFLETTLLRPESCINDDVVSDNLQLVRKKIETDRDPKYKSSLLVHVVVSNGDPSKWLRRLLALGLDPNVSNNMGHCAAQIAASRLNYECAKCLIMCRPWRDVGCPDAESFVAQIESNVKVRALLSDSEKRWSSVRTQGMTHDLF